MIRAFVQQGRALGKPVAITEFGCATYKGAADGGAASHNVLEWNGGRPIRLNDTYVRDETEQATYIRELLDVFESEGVDSAVVYTFAGYVTPRRPDDPDRDLDTGWPGIVKVYDDGRWEPKEAFRMLARYYRTHRSQPATG